MMDRLRWTLALLVGLMAAGCGSSSGDGNGAPGGAGAGAPALQPLPDPLGSDTGPGSPAQNTGNMNPAGALQDANDTGPGAPSQDPNNMMDPGDAPQDAQDESGMAPSDPANDGNQPGAGDPAPMVADWEPDYWPTQAWQEQTPEEQGYDPALLDAAVSFASEASTQALLVIQDGYIISEDYFGSFSKDQRHQSFSMAKSFTSGLVGIAIGEGLIPDGVDTRICEYYEAWNCDDASNDHSKIALKHLLTLTSGLEWTEDWSSAANILGNEAARLGNAPVDYVLGKPSEHEPGTSFQYSTGDPALITGVLQTATGKTALAYAEEKVLGPIGMTNVSWGSDRDGQTTTFAGLQATARNFARYGFLYLNRGRWDGEQLVPADWVDVSTQPGPSLQPWYGYLWHVDLAAKFEDPELPSDGYTAMGIQGQLITVIPSERLLVVRLAGDAIGTDVFDEAGLYNRILAAKSDSP